MVNYWTNNRIVPGRYPEPENKILYWEGTDSLENFNKYTLGKVRNTDRQYRENTITYEHNSYGYRTKEFEFDTDRPSILCVGCSFTYGTGNFYEEIWPSLLEKKYPDYNVYNLGWPGGSGDSVVRILWSVGNKLNTKTVCILWPDIHRFDLYTNYDYVINISPVNRPDLYSKDLLNSDQYQNLQQKNLAFLDLLAEKYQWQVIQNSSDWVMSNLLDCARDTHPGPKTHRLIADYYINNLG